MDEMNEIYDEMNEYAVRVWWDAIKEPYSNCFYGDRVETIV